MSQRLRDILLLIALGMLAYLPGIGTLPVIDRDEARYAQSVVQMIETGDYIDIRFQDESRYKKPVGAYWAQVAAVHATGQADDVRQGQRPIWAQRLPSVLGALAAVIFTYLAGLRLFGRREAIIGAAFLAVSVSLVFEAHQAKTDALLAGACAAALYGLVARKAWAFWPAIGLGMLLKGPVIVGVVALACLSLAILDRREHSLDWRWLAAPLPVLATLAFALPWFIAIGVVSDGAFYAEALGRDFGAKLGSAQETHGGPPGYYALTTIVMFWPGVIALPLAVVWAWRERHTSPVVLLLTWLVPMWLVLEIVPTKLPHYTLPLYPALALLCGAAMVRGVPTAWQRGIGGLAFAGVGLCLMASVIFLRPSLDGPDASSAALGGLALGLVGAVVVLVLTLLWFVRERPNISKPILAGAATSAIFFGVFASGAGALSLTQDIVDYAGRLSPGARLTSPDLREPSLVYLSSTDALRPTQTGDTVILRQGGTDAASCMKHLGQLEGVHYAKGDADAVFTLLSTDACDAAELEAWRQRLSDLSTDSKS